MIRKFVSDRRGNYALMTVITMVPLMGGLALAVDYTELLRQRQETMNALDAAGIATAQQIVVRRQRHRRQGLCQEFLRGQSRHTSNPANTTLTVTLPNNNAGGGTLKLTPTSSTIPISCRPPPC